MNTVLHHFAIWQRQTHSAVLRGSKKWRMRMKSLLPLSSVSSPFRHYSRRLFGQIMYIRRHDLSKKSHHGPSWDLSSLWHKQQLQSLADVHVPQFMLFAVNLKVWYHIIMESFLLTFRTPLHGKTYTAPLSHAWGTSHDNLQSLLCIHRYRQLHNNSMQFIHHIGYRPFLLASSAFTRIMCLKQFQKQNHRYQKPTVALPSTASSRSLISTLFYIYP
jgi:hypothetical protein